MPSSARKHFGGAKKYSKTFYCRACSHRGGNRKKFIGYKVVSKRDGKTFKYVSIGLTRHVNAKSKCSAYYEAKKLNIYDVGTEIEPNKKLDDDVTTVLNDREIRFQEQHVMPVHPQDICRPGFDFATTGIRARDAIFKGIRTKLRITEPKFYPKIANWLPDNKPAQIYVPLFTEALFSLLSNAEIMVEENLLFPRTFTPLSPDNGPPMTENTFILELYHGKWWSES
eukprot:jgi/Psemu1/56994/gm1.56994_g